MRNFGAKNMRNNIGKYRERKYRTTLFHLQRCTPTWTRNIALYRGCSVHVTINPGLARMDPLRMDSLGPFLLRSVEEKLNGHIVSRKKIINDIVKELPIVILCAMDRLLVHFNLWQRKYSGWTGITYVIVKCKAE